MKQFVFEFVRRGLAASVGGPIVLAIVYFILGKSGVIEVLTPQEVALGILTIALLAFIASGFTAIYQIENLSLFTAISIHGIGLYLDYILIYLLNGWLNANLISIGVFTGIFVLGYGVIWLLIYSFTKSSVNRVNKRMRS